MDNSSVVPTLRKFACSWIDKTIKFSFLSEGQIIEFSYINKNDGKDIICAPTQTSCSLKCSFCFLSDNDLVVRNLTAEEILYCVSYIVRVKQLPSQYKDQNKVLLVSFMGCGEPLLNIKNVIGACKLIKEKYDKVYKIVRFSVASLIPNLNLMRKFTTEVKKEGIPLKFHLSLHSPDPETRKINMPASSSIIKSIQKVKDFISLTGNLAEIYYTLIDGVNDREEDLVGLILLLKGTGINIKFIAYNEKPFADFLRSPMVEYFCKRLKKEGIRTEYYISPGSDIGSSCGQFLIDCDTGYNRG